MIARFSAWLNEPTGESPRSRLKKARPDWFGRLMSLSLAEREEAANLGRKTIRRTRIAQEMDQLIAQLYASG